MDLEVVGRHAMLFDDDTMASFVNSTGAFVDWNSLSIDRYDVRHLLSSPPPPRSRRHKQHDSVDSELDQVRYLDLVSPSIPQDLHSEAGLENAGGYHTVFFTYGNHSESTIDKNTNTESVFCPPFPVPKHLVGNLMLGEEIGVLQGCHSQPPTEKVHQIIARTAMFVSKHGGQSEIILRVKQGDNPTFGFLMPDHDLHPYFRFLVDHEELLKSDIDSKSVEEESRVENGLNQAAGALSLLGSAYGSGEDEEGASTDARAVTENNSEEAVNPDNLTISPESEEGGSSLNLAGKGMTSSKYPVLSSKERDHVIRRNRPISTLKAGTTFGMRKGGDLLSVVSSTVDKLQTCDSSSLSKVEASILEPPSDVKRVVEKIVEFILRNGKEFETVLIQQDSNHGRFPFLLPSNQYYPFYINVLQKAQKARLGGTSYISEKHGSLGLGIDEQTACTKSEALSLSSDIPYDSNRKEKFKMVIGKSKKNEQDPPSKATRPQVGVSVDAAAAAAILQAATKGVKNPCLEILPKTLKNGIGQGPSTESGPLSGLSSLLSSQSQSSIKMLDHGEPGVSNPVGKAVVQTAAVSAASEADSSEASLTREQKLKAERLKRAKLFAAMIRNGAAPSRGEPLCNSSVEPPESGFSASNTQGIEREGSLCRVDVDPFDKVQKFEKKDSADGYNERRSKRRYRTRSKREEELEAEVEENWDHKHSRKKKRSHHCSHHSSDRHKRRRKHTLSKDRGSPYRHKHDSTSDDEHKHAQGNSADEDEIKLKHENHSDYEIRHSYHGFEQNSSSNVHEHSQLSHKVDFSSEDEHMNRGQRHGHGDSSDDEYRNASHAHFQRSRHLHKLCGSDVEDRYKTGSVRHGKTSHLEGEADLEEGEIRTKSDQCEGGHCPSREAHVDLSKSYHQVRSSSRRPETSDVSDDLRAKIRAMLMATL